MNPVYLPESKQNGVIILQKPWIMAFRKRLKKRGYTDVSIRKIKDTELYLVTGVEPLASSVISRECSVSFMVNSFRF